MSQYGSKIAVRYKHFLKYIKRIAEASEYKWYLEVYS